MKNFYVAPIVTIKEIEISGLMAVSNTDIDDTSSNDGWTGDYIINTKPR